MVRVVMTKWGERPHWEFDCLVLGSDDHGDWLGVRAGTHMSRPAAEYVAPVDQVVLAPVAGEDWLRGWVATFHAQHGSVHTYVDMTTPPLWDGPVLRCVDLDLDVVRGTTGRVWIDDEDEFAEHRVAFGYPEEVAALAMTTVDRIHRAVSEEQPPFDGVAQAWLSVLADRS